MSDDGPPRTVKPRKPGTNADRPILVMVGDTYCDEAGATGSRDELLTLLRRTPPSIVVTADESVALLKQAHDRYGTDPNFQFAITPIRRQLFRPNCPQRPMYALHNSVRFFGWTNEACGRGNSVRNRYHLLLDPRTFSEAGHPERTLAAHMAWAQFLRAFCIEQQKKLTPTAGGIGRQFWTDPRFYPNPRRKVPRATNDKAREFLPGNHHGLAVEPSVTEYQGTYLDQRSAHHYHARSIQAPCANTLYGYRAFRTVRGDARHLTDPDRVALFMRGFSGLLTVTLRWPLGRRQDGPLIPEFLQGFTERLRNGDRGVQTIWTTDIPLLQSLGVEVSGIIAAWGSYDRDTGLAAYAKWAQEYLAAHDPSPLLKAILLTPYGALATTPRKHTVGYAHSKGGTPATLRTKSQTELPVSLHETTKESEPSTNNVIHRGLIEASVRAEALMYAHHLQAEGHRVLCGYADGLIVEGELPAYVPAPWREQAQLTGLRFIGPTQFVSHELAKLPGTRKDRPGTERAERALRAQLGRFQTTGEKHEHWRPTVRRSATEARKAAIEAHDQKVLAGRPT